MIDLLELTRSIHAYNLSGRRITRVYLPDDEYAAIVAEGERATGEPMGRTPWGEERRVAPAMAPCYRLSELALHNWSAAAEAACRLGRFDLPA